MKKQHAATEPVNWEVMVKRADYLYNNFHTHKDSRLLYGDLMYSLYLTVVSNAPLRVSDMLNLKWTDFEPINNTMVLRYWCKKQSYYKCTNKRCGSKRDYKKSFNGKYIYHGDNRVCNKCGSDSEYVKTYFDVNIQRPVADRIAAVYNYLKTAFKKEPNEYLFYNYTRKQRYNAAWIKLRTQADNEKGLLTDVNGMKLEKIGTHSLRKSLGHTLMQHTGNIAFVKELYKHKNISSTQAYIKPPINEFNAVMDKVLKYN